MSKLSGQFGNQGREHLADFRNFLENGIESVCLSIYLSLLTQQKLSL